MKSFKKVYDLSYLSDLYGEDQVALKRSISVLLETFPDDIKNIEKAFRKKDWNTFFSIGHKLKTPVKMLRIGDIYDDMETMVEQTRGGGYTPEVDNLFLKILPILQEAYRQLSEYIND